MLSIAKYFRNICFFLHFCYCLQQVRCVVFEINSNFLSSQQILIFLHKRPYISPSFPKAIGALCQRCFQKHQRFTICVLVLTVGDVYNISNKSQLPNKVVKHLLFDAKDPISLLHFQKTLALWIAEFPGYIFFTIFFTGFENESGI